MFLFFMEDNHGFGSRWSCLYGLIVLCTWKKAGFYIVSGGFGRSCLFLIVFGRVAKDCVVSFLVLSVVGGVKKLMWCLQHLGILVFVYY